MGMMIQTGKGVILVAVAMGYCAVVSAKATLMDINDVRSGGLLLPSKIPGRHVPAPLLGTKAGNSVSGPVARVNVWQTFLAPSKHRLEGRHVFRLPQQSTVHRMTMRGRNMEIVAKIKGKEAARKIYRQAQQSDARAALAEWHRATAPQPHDIVFVLYKSGSMTGAFIRQASKGPIFAVERLKPVERINPLRLANQTDALFNGLQQVTDASRHHAVRYVKGTRADGWDLENIFGGPLKTKATSIIPLATSYPDQAPRKASIQRMASSMKGAVSTTRLSNPVAVLGQSVRLSTGSTAAALNLLVGLLVLLIGVVLLRRQRPS